MSPLESGFVEVVELSVRGGVLIGLGLVARFALRRVVPPRFLFAGWLLLAALLLLPWRVSVPWHLWAEAPVASAPLAVSSVDQPSEVSQPVRLAVPSGEPTPARELRIVAPPRIETASFDFLGQAVVMTRSWLVGLAALWLTGVAVLVVVRVVALRRLARALRRTRHSSAVRLSEAVKVEARALGLKKTPAVIVTSLVETPALCGILRPKLLFPVGFETRVSSDELAWVVRHELAHLQRRDTWAQAWMQAACAAHWFNPLVWLAARVAREDGELACDEAVLRRHAGTESERQAYGETLLSVIGGARNAPRLPAAVGIVEGQRQLMKRIIQIAAHRPPTLLRTLLGVALLTGVVAVGATEATSTAAAESVTPAPANVPAASKNDGLPSDIQWDRGGTYTLEGIGRVMGEPVAIISVDGNLAAVTTDSSLPFVRVLTIDVERKKVVLTNRENVTRLLNLTTSNPIELPQISAQRLEFLLSKQNLKQMSEYRGPSDEITMVWDKVNRAGQAQVLTSYLQAGWAVSIHRSSHGSGASARNLLQNEIRTRNKKREDTFLASLAPEQRARFNPRQQAIRLTASPEEREKQMAALKAVEAGKAEVVASLTPEQRALYDEWQSWIFVPKPVMR